MKKTIFIATIILIMTNVLAQTKQVPQNVVKAFTAKYPTAIAKKWKQNDSNYFVVFESNDKKSTAYYSSDGNWKKTETKIAWIKNLPTAVKKTLYDRGFLGYFVRNMRKSETATGDLYIVEVNNGNVLDADHAAFAKTYEIDLDGKGNLVNYKELNQE